MALLASLSPLQLTESLPDEARSTGAHNLSLRKRNYRTRPITAPHELRHRDPIGFLVDANLRRLKPPLGGKRPIYRDRIPPHIVLYTAWVKAEPQSNCLDVRFLDRPDEIKAGERFVFGHVTRDKALLSICQLQ